LQGNALRMDWNDVVPAEELDYILGNPPFIGARIMSKAQKEDLDFAAKSCHLKKIAGEIPLKNVGNLDYVCAWFFKAAAMMQRNPALRTAFVATNSISQGEQPAILWKPLFEAGFHIDFAYRTFQWHNEAKGVAAVHCVIEGFSLAKARKALFEEGRILPPPANINAYLVDAENVFIENRKKPLCKGAAGSEGRVARESAETGKNSGQGREICFPYAIPEMGIGNTTTSSAILCCLLKVPVEKVTGRGGGITDAAFEKKLRVVREGLLNNAPDPGDPLDVLAKVGGFDIAAMAGAFVGAAGSRVPVVIDGFISVTAALLACRLEPRVREFLIPSHESFEIGYRLAIGEMGLRPLFSLGMRLGEGSGCPIAFQILEAACAIRNEMATFTEAGIDDGYLEEIRQGDKFTVEERS